MVVTAKKRGLDFVPVGKFSNCIHFWGLAEMTESAQMLGWPNLLCFICRFLFFFVPSFFWVYGSVFAVVTYMVLLLVLVLITIWCCKEIGPTTWQHYELHLILYVLAFIGACLALFGDVFYLVGILLLLDFFLSILFINAWREE